MGAGQRSGESGRPFSRVELAAAAQGQVCPTWYSVLAILTVLEFLKSPLAAGLHAKLGTYVGNGKTDFKGARKVVNGTTLDEKFAEQARKITKRWTKIRKQFYLNAKVGAA